MGVLLNFA